MSSGGGDHGDVASRWREKGAKTSANEIHGALASLVPAALAHTGAVAFDEHLRGVEAVVRSWVPDDEALCLAGLFHSIYGTEGFQGFCLPFSERPKIRKIIGERAERLAWLFCCVDRASFDRAVLGSDILTKEKEPSQPGDPCRLKLRARPELGAFELRNTEADFLDLCLLFLADILEQIEGLGQRAYEPYKFKVHDGWKYRRFAYKAMRDILYKERNLQEAHLMYDAIYSTQIEGCIPLTPPITDAARTAQMAIASRDI